MKDQLTLDLTFLQPTIEIISKERVRDHGEVFTPDHIVEAMHDLVNQDGDLFDPECDYLEPTCGNGQFIIQALMEKVKAFRKIESLRENAVEISINTIWGMYIAQDNIDECHRRIYMFLKHHLIANEGMKIDSKEYKNRICKIVAIVENNIFSVRDSLAYIQNGSFASKPRFNEIEKEIQKEKLKTIRGQYSYILKSRNKKELAMEALT